MIKKIPKNQLQIGMYVNDLHHVWVNHPFDWQCFLVNDNDSLGKDFKFRHHLY